MEELPTPPLSAPKSTRDIRLVPYASENSSGVGSVASGSSSTKRVPTSSKFDEFVSEACEPNNRRNGMTFGFVMALFLLIVAANTGGSETKTMGFADTTSPQQVTFVEPPEMKKVEENIVVASNPHVVTVDSGAQQEEERKNEKRKLPKFPTLEPDIERGPVDETLRAQLAEKWGNWHFWDGDAEMRPTEDYCDKYPNRDIPGEKFPDNAWQVDAVYVNHYLNDAEKLVSRAMETIFTEYGHGKPLPPEEMAKRMKMFHWEKVDLSDPKAGPPKIFQKRGSRDIGGWTTKKSFDGLVRRLLHSMITQDTFTVVLAGHSAAQGQGNHFRQSYMMQFHKIMKPIFERLGVKLITRNLSQGGLGTLQGGMGSANIYGDEIDMFLWDSGMTENNRPHHIELVLRQALISGNRVPLIWGGGGPHEQMRFLHDHVDADIGEYGTGYAGIPVTKDEEHEKTLPWAARRMKCAEERKDLCGADRYRCTCWLNRTDGILPHRNQRPRPKGQVKWHPGWRPHQLMGRVLAFSVLEGLETAINTWMEGTMTGQPLDDEFWHVTEYYDNVRNKLKNLDPKLGQCHEINGTLPLRMCSTPMKGRTHYTPRANYEASSITSIIKPAPDGYVPKNTKTPLYEGPDVHNPNYDIPEGEIDVLAIVSGRRLTERTHTMALGNNQDSYRVMNQTSATSSLRGMRERPSTRRLDTGIVPGTGWELFGEPQGLCDGTYDAVCAHSGDEECFLYGHHDDRGAIVGNEFSGWLVMTLQGVKEGMIVMKLHTWHYASENTRTKGWTEVNNGAADHRVLEEIEEEDEGPAFEWDRAYPTILDPPSGRRLMRSYETPELPDTFQFEYAIDGKITTLNKQEFLENKQNLQRVVETLTLLDDPNFTSNEKDVEVAIRLRGVERKINFGVSHIYWA